MKLCNVIGAGKLHAMSRPVKPVTMLRIVLCALLAFGLCLQPVLAAACDVEDATTLIQDGLSVSGTHGDTAGGADDCCANPACGDCCLQATASMPHTALAVPMSLPGQASTPLPDDVRSSDYPVDIRPPIKG